MIYLRLDELLTEKGMTAYALAKQTGLHQSVISKLRHNNSLALRLDVLDTICKALSVTPCDVLQFTDEDKSLTLSSSSVTNDTSEDKTRIDATAADVPLSAPVIDSETWLSTSEAAARLGIAARTVRDWIKRGKLPATPRQTPQGFSNFIKESDLTAFIKQRERQE